MALLAEGVRTANKNASNGFNTNFHSWDSKNRMDEVFGTKSNFSKYASAGAAIIRHKDILGGKVEQLPLTITALYAIHDMTAEDAALCLEDHYTRKDASIADKAQFKKKGKKPQPAINPSATGASITAWLKNWRNPPLPNTDKRRLPFITLKADLSVYDFAKDASFAGSTSIEQLELIEEKIREAIVGQGAHVAIESKFLDIKKSYEKKKHTALDSAQKNYRIQTEILKNEVIDAIDRMLVAMLEEHPRQLEETKEIWHDGEKSLRRLKKYQPELFEKDCQPRFVDVFWESSSKSEKGFGPPINSDPKTIWNRIQVSERGFVDCSPFAIGVKPKSLILGKL